MRSGSWGLWHDKVNAEDILAVPIRFGDGGDRITTRICAAVDDLQHADPDGPGLFDLDDLISRGISQRRPDEVLRDIDEAVFDLFDLSLAERDLVSDFHRYNLGLAGDWRSSRTRNDLALPSVASGTADDIARVEQSPIREYLDRFLSEWNPAIAPAGQFGWQVIGAPDGDMLCALFETLEMGQRPGEQPDLSSWYTMLERLASSLLFPSTRDVATDNIVRNVSDTSIIIVKRREARL